MNIVMKKIPELIPYARNNKKHSESQIKKVAASIQEFGFTQPIVIDSKNSIVIGHCRVKSAELLGMGEVPCFIADDLTKAQISALRITDNKMSELAEWDNEMLGLELQELAELDFDISLTGFDIDEAEALSNVIEGSLEDIEEDEVPVAKENPYSKMGDLWLLGRHRLLCGDSTKEEDVKRLMDGKKADIGFNDPPYGMKKEKDGVLNDNLNFNNTHDNQNNVWNFKRTTGEEREDAGGHATPKPLELCGRAIKSSSRENDLVIDMFGGSGSTLIASDKLNRICNVMEYESKWTDVIVKRYHNLGKEDITLIRDGKEYKWEDIKTEIIK